MSTQNLQELDDAVLISDYVKSFLLPVSPEAPCGKDVYDEQDHEMVRHFFEQRDSVNRQIDHRRLSESLARETSGKEEEADTEENTLVSRPQNDAVIRAAITTAEQLLKSTTKDFQIASYLTIGLAETKGYPGLNDGVVLLWGMMDALWDGSFPKSKLGKQGALQFAAQKLNEFVGSTPAVENDREYLESAVAAMKRLQKVTIEKMENKAPALSDTLEGLGKALSRLPVPVVEEIIEEGKSTDVTPGHTANTASQPDTARDQAAEKKLRIEHAGNQLENGQDKPLNLINIREQTVQFIRQWRQVEPGHPGSYALLRTFLWAGVTEAPAPELLVYAPDPLRVDYFNKAMERKEYKEVLEEAEGDIAEFPYWLDLQRYVTTCMQRLGFEYESAAIEVLDATALLVSRVPTLQTLKFGNDTPLADGQTLGWLEEDVLPRLGGAGEIGGGALSMNEQDEQRNTLFDEARSMLDKKGLSEALSLLRRGERLEETQRGKFQCRLQEAMLCIRGNAPDIAAHILEELDARITLHRLDEWDPAVALQVWEQWYQCLHLLDNDEAIVDVNKSTIFEKVTRLDSILALRLREKYG